MTYRLTILGCGSSPGVPRINGEWGACDPSNPRNRRLRCSVLIERFGPEGVTTVVVDTSPDFREQMLAANVKTLDGVLYTHGHADHVHGIDDLRQYALVQRRRIPTYADAPTTERLKQAFGYCFETPPGSQYPPILEHTEIHPGKIVRIAGEGGPVEVLPILQEHGDIVSLGFRFGGDLAGLKGGLCYSPDISGIPEQSQPLLQNLDVWIVDALQYRSHVSHFSLAESVEWIERLKPVSAFLTHMHIPLDYAAVAAETPKHVQPAYDGLRIEVD